MQGQFGPICLTGMWYRQGSASIVLCSCHVLRELELRKGAWDTNSCFCISIVLKRVWPPPPRPARHPSDVGAKCEPCDSKETTIITKFTPPKKECPIPAELMARGNPADDSRTGFMPSMNPVLAVRTGWFSLETMRRSPPASARTKNI